MYVPQDPILLMSTINTLLRDQYDSLEALCDDRELDAADIRARLEGAGYQYDAKQNQFR